VSAVVYVFVEEYAVRCEIFTPHIEGSIHGGAGRKLLPQTPKLPPQNLVTDHGIQEIFGLNRIKSDLKTSQNQKISWGILPQTPYTMCTSVVSSLHCKMLPPQKYFAR